MKRKKKKKYVHDSVSCFGGFHQLTVPDFSYGAWHNFQ